jgi:UDP-N-acetylglucosamine--N-acetylmuramyl-(pentapeptide) pyrophosphoryl-undecaprenol N-acetylglucosamine transferase
MPHLVIMAAGTGGHIIPGLAVAREMQGRGWSVSWLGTTPRHGKPARAQGRHPAGHHRFSGLRGKGLLHTATGGLRLLKAFWDCLRHPAPARCRRRAGHGRLCVLSRWPDGQPAGKPLVLVNADAALLLSNKALLPVADRVAFGFDGDAARHVKHAVVTGNPVRAEIEALPAPAERFAGRSGPLRCWWSAAAWARRCSTTPCPPRWR